MGVCVHVSDRMRDGYSGDEGWSLQAVFQVHVCLAVVACTASFV